VSPFDIIFGTAGKRVIQFGISELTVCLQNLGAF